MISFFHTQDTSLQNIVVWAFNFSFWLSCQVSAFLVTFSWIISFYSPPPTISSFYPTLLNSSTQVVSFPLLYLLKKKKKSKTNHQQQSYSQALLQKGMMGSLNTVKETYHWNFSENESTSKSHFLSICWNRQWVEELGKGPDSKTVTLKLSHASMSTSLLLLSWKESINFI